MKLAVFGAGIVMAVAAGAQQPIQNKEVAAATAVRSDVPAVRVPVRSDSRLWLEGTSNVRDWTCKATSMDATLDVETESVRAVTVKVPVRTLKCGDRHMEAHMYDALKAPQPPAASYIYAEFDKLPIPKSDQDEIKTTGKMTVAGVERVVEMTVRTDKLPDGTRRAFGKVPILMTDFGITPPRPWMGLLRAGNRVLIQFEIFISPEALRAAQASASPMAGH
jgi:polyisoprenoid-binding protein YceI